MAIGVTISSQSGWRMEQLTALEDEQLACTPTEELLDLGNLTIRKYSRYIACLSISKKM